MSEPSPTNQSSAGSEAFALLAPRGDFPAPTHLASHALSCAGRYPSRLTGLNDQQQPSFGPQHAPPPLRRLEPHEVLAFLWNGPDSLPKRVHAAAARHGLNYTRSLGDTPAMTNKKGGWGGPDTAYPARPCQPSLDAPPLVLFRVVSCGGWQPRCPACSRRWLGWSRP